MLLRTISVRRNYKECAGSRCRLRGLISTQSPATPGTAMCSDSVNPNVIKIVTLKIFSGQAAFQRAAPKSLQWVDSSFERHRVKPGKCYRESHRRKLLAQWRVEEIEQKCHAEFIPNRLKKR